MATTNFLAWANGANIESDPTWASDPLRTGNIPVNAVLPSPMLNKLFRQATVMVAALAQALQTKGYSTSDANQNTLAAVLVNLVTQFDLANSPALGGNPTAPTQAGSDNSTKIASTAFVKSAVDAITIVNSNPGYIQFPNGLIVNFGTGAVAGGGVGNNQSLGLAFPNTGVIALCCYGSIPPSSGACGVDFIDNATIVLANSASGTNGVHWIAIGF